MEYTAISVSAMRILKEVHHDYAEIEKTELHEIKGLRLVDSTEISRTIWNLILLAL